MREISLHVEDALVDTRVDFVALVDTFSALPHELGQLKEDCSRQVVGVVLLSVCEDLFIRLRQRTKTILDLLELEGLRLRLVVEIS